MPNDNITDTWQPTQIKGNDGLNLRMLEALRKYGQIDDLSAQITKIKAEIQKHHCEISPGDKLFCNFGTNYAKPFIVDDITVNIQTPSRIFAAGEKPRLFFQVSGFLILSSGKVSGAQRGRFRTDSLKFETP